MASLKSQIGKWTVGTWRKSQQFLSLEIAPYWHFHVQRMKPLLVYQMGKVGSSTIASTVDTYAQYPVYHVHNLRPKHLQGLTQDLSSRGIAIPPHLYTGKMVSQHIIARGLPAKIITLVRDPIARALSDFFQNYTFHTGKTFVNDLAIVQDHIESHLKRDHFDYPLRWFQNEFQPILGIDVFEHPFPHEQGYLRIKTEGYDILLLRIETDDAIITQALA
ncbi:MAG: putative capsular polysaccharide synthesis family protein, partial [Chloroflexota bacterium]